MAKEETEELYFTPEEISVIDKNLGSVVFDWAKNLINNIIVSARQKGVNNLYMNTSKTLDSGSNDDKTQYFYETFPERMGFKRTEANLRGKGMEELWVMELNSVQASRQAYEFVRTAQEDRMFTLEQIPSRLQGAVISFIGKKPQYSKSELLKVVSILEEKENKAKDKKPKTFAKFFYDWTRTWSGSQRFNNNITEVVVEMKLTNSMYDLILSNPVLKKFMAFVTSQQGHFDVSPGLNETIGFALVSMNGKNWLINEIQTDSINKYLDIRAKYYKGRDKGKAEKMSWDTIKDMLQAQNKSNWIAKLEINEPLKQQLIDNPNLINQLPDNSVDIEKWLSEQRAHLQNNNGRQDNLEELTRAVQAVNFNARVFKAG